MATVRHALVLWALVGAGPALAQSPAPIDPGARAGRAAIAAPGRTKPPALGLPANAALPKPATEAQMLKAQKAAEARSKAWDTRMRRTMGSICNGC